MEKIQYKYMMNTVNANKILYDYIIEQYGDVVEFSNKSGVPHIDLNAVLLKDNVPKEICIGLDLCNILNIDVEEFIFSNKIKESEEKKYVFDSGKNDKADIDGIDGINEIHSKCMRLSEMEKKKVLEYITGLMNEAEAEK